MGQSLTMTPALQQAISLLQLSSQDLHLEIQTFLESNIMLEQESAIEQDLQHDANLESDQSDASVELDDLPQELDVDCEWDDVYDVSTSTAPGPTSDDYYQNIGEEQQTLHDHLIEQVLQCRFNQQDLFTAACILNNLDDDGFLVASNDELFSLVATQHADVEMAEIQAVLEVIQRLEPQGVATISLEESLSIQLEVYQHVMSARVYTAAQTIVQKHFSAIPSGVQKLARLARCSAADVEEALAVVRQLKPYPASEFQSYHAEYIKPDVYVSVFSGRLKLEINPELAPRLRINGGYSRAMEGATGADAQVMRNHYQEARWFMKSLQARNETLMKVAASIIEKQRDYFFKGEVALKPLVLREIAEKIDMHESTVSRVTSNKYMATPQGLIPFKYFFSSHVGTADGGECSSIAIQAMIKKLVAEEPPAKPLSDNKLATQLQAEGINVARRTIAKYREALGIPPSHERKTVV